MTDLLIRPLREEDTEAIIRLDAKLTDGKRSGFWRGMLRAYMDGEPGHDTLFPGLCHVAVQDGKLVGFVLADVQSWQYGIERCGRIVTLGVDPDARRKGVARQLVEAAEEVLRSMRADQILCLVKPDDPLHDFFRAVGFEETEWQVVKRTL